MLLNSGHTLAVPPDFVLHPQTGQIVPIAGNVAYDPESSALVFTTDLCTGKRKDLSAFEMANTFDMRPAFPGQL